MMIRICPACSNVDIDRLKAEVGEENVDITCIGQCGMEYVAYADDELVEASNEDELISALKGRI